MKTPQETLFAEAAAPPGPSTVKLYSGDCLDVMPQLETGSVDFFFADLPYGETRRLWDKKLLLEGLWKQLNPLVKQNAVSCFTASMKFSVDLISSNKKSFRHDLVWAKGRTTGFLNANRMPLRQHEHVLIFSRGRHIYNPQKTPVKPYLNKRGCADLNYGKVKDNNRAELTDGKRFPTSIVAVSSASSQNVHPTQKPVALLEFLIATYTNPGDTVLDPCFGSNTTGVACARLGRNYVGIEKDPEYFRIGSERLAKERERLGLT